MSNAVRSFVKRLSSMNNWMWHNVSESKETRFRTIIEFLVAALVFITCLYLYSKWNGVPKHTDVIEVACLNYHQPDSDKVTEWSPVVEVKYEINTSKLLSGNLRPGEIHMKFKNWKPSNRYEPASGISRHDYVRDSIALHSDYWRAARLKRDIVAARVSGRPCENETAELSKIISYSNDFDDDSYAARLDSSCAYQTRLLGLLDDELKALYKDSMDVYEREKAWWFDNPTTDYHALYFFQTRSKWNISDHKDCTEGPNLQGASGVETITSLGYKDSVYFRNTFILRSSGRNVVGISDKDIIDKVESPLKCPEWDSKFNISQSYFNVSLRCESVDSIVLKFDFVGATDFSQMTPKPDSIDMSSITFSDPVKIAQIKEKGLTFHAHFKEKDGLQTIRLFAVTALMCVFTPKLLLCIVNMIILVISGIKGLCHRKKNQHTTS